MIRAFLVFLLFLLCILCLPAAAQPPAWTVEVGSRVGYIAKQSGAEVDGVFEVFDAEIAFAPEDLAASRVAVTIEIASVNSQSRERDDAIKGKGLFNAITWPTARFEAAEFAHKGGDLYEARGRLTLRDQTRPVVLPFTLAIAPHPERDGALLAQAKGELEISRLDYGVGQGMWQDTSVVADEVRIFIDIRATRPAE
ncbi:MAG: YceI family protein [Kiloniellales bacterium]|nr:YceI family protein [Kiloniellales bacterium]